MENKNFKKFIKERIKWAKNNPEKARQHIRDLYNKMFPRFEDYIKYIRSKWKNEKYLLKIGMILKEHKNQEDNALWRELDSNIDENIIDNLLAKNDYWHNITPKQINKYLELTEKWIDTRNKYERTIWNYYVLGVPINRIVSILNRDKITILRTIFDLQEDFIKSIPPILKK